jgi:hypothetical protein
MLIIANVTLAVLGTIALVSDASAKHMVPTIWRFVLTVTVVTALMAVYLSIMLASASNCIKIPLFRGTDPYMRPLAWCVTFALQMTTTIICLGLSIYIRSDLNSAEYNARSEHKILLKFMQINLWYSAIKISIWIVGGISLTVFYTVLASPSIQYRDMPFSSSTTGNTAGNTVEKTASVLEFGSHNA